MDDSAFEKDLPEDLRQIADALTSGREVLDGHGLDRVQRRIAAARPRRPTLRVLRQPIFGAIVVALVAIVGVGVAHRNISQFASSLAGSTSTNGGMSAAGAVYCTAGGGAASIQSNFNGTAIAAGNVIWFSAVFKVSGLPMTGGTITFTHQTISGIPGVPGSVTAPDSQVTITPGATPSAVYNPGTNTWDITLPTGFSGNGLLAAVPVVDTNGAPHGGQGSGPTWSGTVTSSGGTGVTINWQWAAAVYPASSGFPTTPAGYNAIGVSPLDGFVGSDHAGTPENFKTHVIGGATGGGGSNYTGSLSGTQGLTCVSSPPPPGTPKGESLLADPNPAANSTVTPGHKMTIVYTDDSPIGTGSNAPTAVLSGTSLPVTVTATSGQPQNYVDTNGGSKATTHQDLLSFTLPSSLAPGSYSVQVTVHDGDGDIDQWSWPIKVS